MEINEKSKVSAPFTKVLIGNNVDVLRGMGDESVDLVVTSPPYWALRDYKSPPQVYGGDENCEHEWSDDCHCTKCGAWRGQLGLEPSPLEYIDHLVSIFDEVKRVLKPAGACWINLGDTYATVSSSGFQGDNKCTFRSKSLVQIPSRFAIAMTDHGWILRNEVIWHKPNVMPTPVKDRFTVDFKKFFFFTKNEKYYFNQQLESVKEESIQRAHRTHHTDKGTNAIHHGANDPNWQRYVNPEGRNMRTVWSISTKGERYKHVAMFPKSLIERPIKSCCPPGGIVMDIFAGSGTVMSYCKENGINSIGIEVNPDYEQIINERVSRSNFTPKLDDF